MSDAAFHIVQLSLSIPGVIGLGKRRRLPMRNVDEGYLVHCALKELFGDKAPQPFSVDGGGAARGRLTVLGYSDFTHQDLQNEAQAVSEPMIYDLCDWSTLSSKEMPSEWQEGAGYRFRLRACPVVRKSSDGPHFRRGAEVDVFLDRALGLDKGMELARESVYREWLEEQFARRTGVELESCALRGFRRLTICRRRHAEGKRSELHRPDALLEGRLRVVDSAGFSKLLRSGVGRHRAFGFGMLLLRPS